MRTRAVDWRPLAEQRESRLCGKKKRKKRKRSHAQTCKRVQMRSRIIRGSFCERLLSPATPTRNFCLTERLEDRRKNSATREETYSVALESVSIYTRVRAQLVFSPQFFLINSRVSRPPISRIHKWKEKCCSINQMSLAENMSGPTNPG